MAKDKRPRRSGETPEPANLTPMIDVVFHLLVFFVVTFEPLDIMTHLGVKNPRPDTETTEIKLPEFVLVEVHRHGFTVMGRPMNLEQCDERFLRLARLPGGQDQTIVIRAHEASKHADLVRILNLCSKAGFKNLSVVSAR